MYRINFYPEYMERRRGRGGRLIGAGLTAGLIGLELLLVAWLLVSGILLRERAEAAERDAQRFSSALTTDPESDPQIDDALALLRLRRQRIDWSPLLAGVTRRIEPSLRLTEITARSAGEERGARIELTGSLRGGGTRTEPVSRFLEALQSDSLLSGRFREVKLQNLGGGSSDRFKIICEEQGSDK